MPDYHTQITELENELHKTQYNKRTQHHVGLLKAKIARLRERMESARGKGGAPEGFQVRKTGDATVLLLGFPSTGKSTLLNAVCGTDSAVGHYAFTTLTVIPGTLVHRHARIQMLDVPGIVSGASSGRGRGREVLAMARSADLCILIVDATRPQELAALRSEAYAAGLRFDQRPPDLRIRRTARRGIAVSSTVRLSSIDEASIRDVLREFRIVNADVLVREDITVEQLIDVLRGNCHYLPSLVVFTKCDLIPARELRAMEAVYHPDLLVSAERRQKIDALRDLIYERLRLISVYLKEPGKAADMEVPLVVRTGSTVRGVCERLHKDFMAKFRFARVWGASAKFPGQKLMLEHVLQDQDIVEMHLR